MSSSAVPRDRIARFPLQDQIGLATPPGPRDGAPDAGTVHRVAGRYRYDLDRGAWWWSPEMYALHGLPDDSGAASTELLLEHLHPEDRARILAAITRACTEGRPFTARTRIVRADGEHRAVVLIGEPETARDGDVTAVAGLVVDLTESAGPDDAPARVEALETEVRQMRAAMASRAAIEQAKGILMLLTGCGEQAAFDLLAHISSHTHRKVRQVAESITESATGQAPLPADMSAIIRDACPPPARRG